MGGRMRTVRARRSRELRLVESAAAAGAVVGLVLALDAPGSAGPCRGGGPAQCVGHTMLAVARPYATHAALGAAVGLAIALAALLVWRSSGSGSGSARPVAATGPGREPIPERVRHEVWRRDRGSCVDCGSRGRLEFDHIIPVSRGGSNTTRNIELRCEPCNRRKGARV
ncbi:MAG: 5-methylcytosine-specific restriction enzyme [Thermoleophilales bacterium]|nr:5-methylcytosine-specific restriction enzyme [Thermoleophilales bacterium]